MLKTVTVLIALLYDGIWREVGEILEMEKGRADYLSKKNPPVVQLGEHTIAAAGESVPKGPAGPVFTPPDFPGAEFLLAVGVANCDQLGELMKTKGDAWFADIDGIGKGTAAKIAAALEKLNAET